MIRNSLVEIDFVEYYFVRVKYQSFAILLPTRFQKVMRFVKDCMEEIGYIAP